MIIRMRSRHTLKSRVAGLHLPADAHKVVLLTSGTSTHHSTSLLLESTLGRSGFNLESGTLRVCILAARETACTLVGRSGRAPEIGDGGC